MRRLLLLLLLAGALAGGLAAPLVFTYTPGRTGTQRLAHLLGQCCAAAGGVCEAAHEPFSATNGRTMLLRNLLGWGPVGEAGAVRELARRAVVREGAFIEVSSKFPYYAEAVLELADPSSTDTDVTVVVLRRDLADTLASWMGAWGDRRVWDAIGLRQIHTPHAPGSATRPLRSLEDSSTGELVAGYLIDLEARLQLLRARFEPLGVRFLEVRTEDVASPAGARWLMGELGLPCPLALDLQDAGRLDAAPFRRAEGDKAAARAAADRLLRAYVGEAARRGVALPSLGLPGSEERLADAAAAAAPALERHVERSFALEVLEPSNGTVAGAAGVPLRLRSDWLPERGPEPGYVRYLGIMVRFEDSGEEFLLDVLDKYTELVVRSATLDELMIRGAGPVRLALRARDCPAAHFVQRMVDGKHAPGVTVGNFEAEVNAVLESRLALARVAERADYAPFDASWGQMRGCMEIGGPSVGLLLGGSGSSSSSSSAAAAAAVWGLRPRALV